MLDVINMRCTQGRKTGKLWKWMGFEEGGARSQKQLVHIGNSTKVLRDCKGLEEVWVFFGI